MLSPHKVTKLASHSSSEVYVMIDNVIYSL
uniref:Uncharacterized protein n=1 Tax=Nelumbo nucifera TaxID=4432 RepID=A0A822Z0H9_NELNU|nr:TPA_asm: hypothetical protein HUJ06_007822 [Nelumbo nucifera]